MEKEEILEEKKTEGQGMLDWQRFYEGAGIAAAATCAFFSKFSLNYKNGVEGSLAKANFSAVIAGLFYTFIFGFILGFFTGIITGLLGSLIRKEKVKASGLLLSAGGNGFITMVFSLITALFLSLVYWLLFSVFGITLSEYGAYFVSFAVFFAVILIYSLIKLAVSVKNYKSVLKVFLFLCLSLAFALLLSLSVGLLSGFWRFLGLPVAAITASVFRLAVKSEE